MMTLRPRVRIVHETNPEKYFHAIFALAAAGEVDLVGAHRYSVVKEWVRSGLKDKRPVRERTRAAWGDLLLRARLPWIRGEVVVLGFAPWDWRLLVYGRLASRNRVIYHTSWHDWRHVPRRYGPLDPVLRRAWLAFLRHPNVQVVSVSPAAHESLRDVLGVSSRVVPHAVSEEFFNVRRQEDRRRGLRLIYVGELSSKKGVRRLLDAARRLQEEGIELTVVGDGVLRGACEAAAVGGDLNFVGPVWDRAKLAVIVAEHDVLVLLPRREGDWQELFGIVLIEAMAAGLGVIGSRHVGPESIMAGWQLNNLFPDDDDVGPWQLIRSLAEDHQRLHEFKASHRMIAEPYRSSEVEKAWMAVLRSDTGRAVAP